MLIFHKTGTFHTLLGLLCFFFLSSCADDSRNNLNNDIPTLICEPNPETNNNEVYIYLNETKTKIGQSTGCDKVSEDRPKWYHLNADYIEIIGDIQENSFIGYSIKLTPNREYEISSVRIVKKDLVERRSSQLARVSKGRLTILKKDLTNPLQKNEKSMRIKKQN